MWIPSDSSLVIGSVVDDEKVAALQKVAQLQQKLEVAKDSYNAQLRNKMSMDMSIQNMKSMKIGTKPERKKLDTHDKREWEEYKLKKKQGKEVDTQRYKTQWAKYYTDLEQSQPNSERMKRVEEVQKKLQEAHNKQDTLTVEALLKLVNARMAYEKEYAELMKAVPQKRISTNQASPMIFSKSTERMLPLGSDSMSMDVQYFRCAEGTEGSSSHVSNVSSYAARSFSGSSWWGYSSSSSHQRIEQETQDHMHQQTSSNNLLGTIVITAKATHKLAKIYDAKYDGDRLVRAWNNKVEGEKLVLPGKLDDHYAEWIGHKDITAETEDAAMAEKKIAILTGQTYGSSFIGFIHFVKKGSSHSENHIRKQATKQTERVESDLWWNNYSGAFGLDSTSADEVKSLLSDATVSSHISVHTCGIIPSIASGETETALKTFTSFDPKETDKKLSMLAGEESFNFEDHVKKSQKAGGIAGIQRGTITAVIAGARDADVKKNKVLDMNSMMNAFDDYVKHVREAEGGTPMTFFVASLRKSDVIGHWLQQHRPDLYMRGTQGNVYKDSDDDSGYSDDSSSDSEGGSDTEGESGTEGESDTEGDGDDSDEDDESETETETTETETEDSDDFVR